MAAQKSFQDEVYSENKMESAFIKRVEKSSALWNPLDPSSSNKKVTNPIWEEISKKMNKPSKDLKGKWEGLKNLYREALREGKAFLYAEEMKFYKEIAFQEIEKKKQEENIKREEKAKKMKQERLASSSDFSVDESETILETKTGVTNVGESKIPVVEESSDLQFLKSLAPDIGKLNDYNKLDFKTHMIHQLKKKLWYQENPGQKLPPRNDFQPYLKNSSGDYRRDHSAHPRDQRNNRYYGNREHPYESNRDYGNFGHSSKTFPDANDEAQ